MVHAPRSPSPGRVRLRPTGASARLDEVAAWLAAWQRTERPAVDAPHAVVFAADHGVAAAAGVSAYPTEVTVAMLDALEKGAATAAAMTKALGMTLDVVDVGVARPTGDLRFEPAMDEARFDEAGASRRRRGRTCRGRRSARLRRDGDREHDCRRRRRRDAV